MLCVPLSVRPPIATLRGTAPVYRGCTLAKLRQRKGADPTCWRKGHRGSQRALLRVPGLLGREVTGDHWTEGCERRGRSGQVARYSLILQGVYRRRVWDMIGRALSAVRQIEPGSEERRGHRESTSRPLVQAEGDPLGMLERDAVRIRLSAHQPPACLCCVPGVTEISRSPPAQPSAP